MTSEGTFQKVLYPVMVFDSGMGPGNLNGTIFSNKKQYFLLLLINSINCTKILNYANR